MGNITERNIGDWGENVNMTKEQYLLFQLAEEAAEVAQRASKAARFGMQEKQPGQEMNNETRLVYEMNDLLAVMDSVLGHQAWMDEIAQHDKRLKIEKYMAYSRELGIVEG